MQTILKVARWIPVSDGIRSRTSRQAFRTGTPTSPGASGFRRIRILIRSSPGGRRRGLGLPVRQEAAFDEEAGSDRRRGAESSSPPSSSAAAAAAAAAVVRRSSSPAVVNRQSSTTTTSSGSARNQLCFHPLFFPRPGFVSNPAGFERKTLATTHRAPLLR